jgi:hypothetical protein
MDRVFATDNAGISPAIGKNIRLVSLPGSVFKEGVVQSVLGQGRFYIEMDGGLRVQARGAASLKPGDKVQVLSAESPQGVGDRVDEEGPVSYDGGLIWTAFIPFAFGGPKANGKLEVHVERRPKEMFKKGSPAVYFLFTVQTETQGEVQWGIHLNAMQVTLQVYAPKMGHQKESLKALVDQVGKSLRSRGFVMSGQVLYSGHPLKSPSDMRLNLRG